MQAYEPVYTLHLKNICQNKQILINPPISFLLMEK